MFLKWRGIPALLGGIAWIAVWTTIALRPAAEAGGYRRVDDMVLAMMAAMALIMVGHAWIHASRRPARVRTVLTFLLSIGGAALMAFGRGMQNLGFDPQPFVGIGWVVLAAGLVLYGICLLSPRRTTIDVGLAYMLGALFLLLSNDQDWRAWFALPFGFAWIWIAIRSKFERLSM